MALGLAAMLLLNAQLPQLLPQPGLMPDWLAGAWTTPAREADWTEEWWTTPRAGLMLGGSRSGTGDTLGFFEHMRIERSDAGLKFCAMPQGRAGACFQSVAANEGEVAFENPANDYPTRIVYRREPYGISAEISGPDGSRKQRWTFVPRAE